MWKKDDEPGTPETPAKKGASAERPRPSDGAEAAPATIGPSITIKGDVSGEEDLLIHGRVNGSVDLKQQSVTVGREGRVNADITGRVVIVEGEVEGDLSADEQVILRSAARVEGDITSPRVVLEDGANFKGLVDMSNPSKDSAAGGSASGSAGASGGSTSAGRSTRSKAAASSGAASGSSGSGSGSDDSDDGSSGKSETSKKAEKAAS